MHTHTCVCVCVCLCVCLCIYVYAYCCNVSCVLQKSGRTALMSAANSGSAKVVKAILSRGANVNALDARKNHAAHFAAKGGHLECLVCMGGFGAQFDQNNMDGNNPVHLAAMGGHAMCCKYLSQRGQSGCHTMSL